MRIERFQVPVNCQIPYKNEMKAYMDCGVLILPETYSTNHVQTRLIISCHGAGGSTSMDDSQIENQTITKYFLANGYAVMDVNGLPYGYAEEFGIDIRNNVGCNIAVDSYCAAYDFCVKNYNLHKEVFVHGNSMGGISSTNLVLSGRIPVIAQTGFCPVLDTYHEIFLHPWQDGLPKIALAKIYSFDCDFNGDYIYDEKKVNGFNPMTSDKVHPCPLFFCHSVNDDIVSAEITEAYISKAEKSGVVTKFLLFPDGKHGPEDYGGSIDNPTGMDIFDNEKLSITIAMEEAFLWFEKFKFKTCS